jgi:hypothetical protein
MWKKKKEIQQGKFSLNRLNKYENAENTGKKRMYEEYLNFWRKKDSIVKQCFGSRSGSAWICKKLTPGSGSLFEFRMRGL